MLIIVFHFSELFEGLKDNNRSQEALTVLERYTDDPEDTIKHAVAFGCYKTALRLCSQFKKDNLKSMYSNDNGLQMKPLLPSIS